MARFERVFVFWICVYTFMITEGIVSGIVYLGCYLDSSDRVLKDKKTLSSSNTPEECASHCSNFRYAGVEHKHYVYRKTSMSSMDAKSEYLTLFYQSTHECFCGNTMNNPHKKARFECNRPCPGDHFKKCGGHWRISVFTNWACGPTPEIENGNATLRKGNNITYGSLADVFCYPGFIAKPTITCLSNKLWEKVSCEQAGTTSIHVTSLSNTTTEGLTSGTTYTTIATYLTTMATSTVKPTTSTTTNDSQIISTSATKCVTSETTYTSRDTDSTTTQSTSFDTATSPKNIQSTTSLSGIDGQSAASKQQASKGSTTSAVAAGVSVTVALAVVAVVIVLVLRNRKKSCFANTKRTHLDNKDDDHHISLQNDSYHAPGAPVLNHSYSELDTGNRKSKEHEASAFIDVTYQNTNNKQGNHVSDAHAYFVLEKDEFELQRNAVNSAPTYVHDYFVLEKQQPHIGNRNGGSTNDVHPYFVLEKEGVQLVHDISPNKANPNFVSEKQNTGDPTPIHTANALDDLENTDGDTYQEIATDDTYAGIHDSREDNNHYDYTSKAFNDSRTETSDNVYNHLNAACDEYDHLGKGQSNFKTMENDYDVTSSAVRK